MGKNKRKEPKGIGKLKAKIEKIEDDVVADYMIIFENKYKRQPTQKQIDKMYKMAHEKVNKNIKRFGIRFSSCSFCCRNFSRSFYKIYR